MILYHGSNMEIGEIDLHKCRPFKDFGRGFYTTPLQEQAWAMAKRTARIYKEGTPCLTEYYLDDVNLYDLGLSVKKFDKPNIDWAHFVINNRNRKFMDTLNLLCNGDAKFDIVTGPVANDDITALIDVFLAGILSNEALVNELTFRELSYQVSFHSERAVACLEKTGVHHG